MKECDCKQYVINTDRMWYIQCFLLLTPYIYT